MFLLRVLLPTLATAAIIIVATLLVKFGTFAKKSHRTQAGKFQNPFKNLNLIIAMVILLFILLHTLTFYIKVPPDLLFPKMPCGFDMVAMCTMFTLFNADAKEHMLRKCPVLRSHLKVGLCKARFQPHFDDTNIGQLDRGSEGISSDFNTGRLFTVVQQNQTNKTFAEKEFIRRPRDPRNVKGWVLTVENFDEN